MSIITVFNGIYCNEDIIIDEIIHTTGFTHIDDQAVLTLASELSAIPFEKLEKTFSSKPSVFNDFTHEKERHIAYLKLAVAKMIAKGQTLFSGYSSLLIPMTLQNALRICLISNMENRLKIAKHHSSLSYQDNIDMISFEDQLKSNWTHLLFSVDNPWDPDLYDVVIQTDQTTISGILPLIKEKLSTAFCNPIADMQSQIDDFLLAATVEVALYNAGHNVNVLAKKGILELSVHHQVLKFDQLEEELKSIVKNIPDVKSVDAKLIQGNKNNHIYRKYSDTIPSKVLLVDDEKEFVQTLSERLQMRKIGSVVIHDGQSALDLVNNDDPEVMIIDLKMPGIDGMEILQKVKQLRPEIEIIVLTGHGSEQDRKKCMDLGAFAYMQKPVDITLLNDSLNQAHNKVKALDANI